MFSKLTVCLAMTISLIQAENAMAQTTNTTKSTKTKKENTAKKAEVAPAVEVKAVEEVKTPVSTPAVEAAKAPAATAPEEKDPVIKYVKDKFSLSYHGEYYYQRRDALSTDKEERKLQDMRVMHNPTIIYRPFKDWKFLFTSEFKYTDSPAVGSWIHGHYRSLALLTKENILTETDHGIKMDVAIGRRIFDRNGGAASSYGNNRVNTTISKKFGSHSGSLMAQYLYNDPANQKINSDTWKHSLELIPTINLQLTDKMTYFFNDDIVINTPWQDVPTQNDLAMTHEMNVGVLSYQFNDVNSSYFQLKYLHIEDFTQYKNQEDWLEYYIGHTYSFTPKMSMTFEIGSELVKNSDGRDGFSKKIEYPELAVYFDVAL
jgi:hypothetical protein